MSELTIKQMQDIATQKELPVPDEGGQVLYESSAGRVLGDELAEKSAKNYVPTDKHMELINSKSLEPQNKDQWMVITKINPLGNFQEVDSHGDVFDPKALKDMSSQAFWTPILESHDHYMNPPIGRCIEATAGKDGLRETWAIPKADYNAKYREALLQGNMSEISIGAFISAENKLCNSCGGGRSIYSFDCPHVPGRKDKDGKLCTVTIKRVDRYAERSLVNIPARMGTSVKGLGAPDLEKELKEALDEVEDTLKDVFNDPLFEKGGLIGIAESLNVPSPMTSEEVTKVIQKALDEAFSGPKGGHKIVVSGAQELENTPPDTIPHVNKSTIEDNIVAETPKDQEPEVVETEKSVEAPVEAPKAEDPPVVAEFDLEGFSAKLVEAVESKVVSQVDLEAVNKALAEQSDNVTKLLEATNKQAERLEEVTKLAAELAETVKKLAEFSSEDAVNKLIEVASQLQEANKKPEAPKEVSLKSICNSVFQ